eukprot:gene3403-427_t
MCTQSVQQYRVWPYPSGAYPELLFGILPRFAGCRGATDEHGRSTEFKDMRRVTVDRVLRIGVAGAPRYRLLHAAMHTRPTLACGHWYGEGSMLGQHFCFNDGRISPLPGGRVAAASEWCRANVYAVAYVRDDVPQPPKLPRRLANLANRCPLVQVLYVLAGIWHVLRPRILRLGMVSVALSEVMDCMFADRAGAVGADPTAEPELCRLANLFYSGGRAHRGEQVTVDEPWVWLAECLQCEHVHGPNVAFYCGA